MDMVKKCKSKTDCNEFDMSLMYICNLSFKRGTLPNQMKIDIYFYRPVSQHTQQTVFKDTGKVICPKTGEHKKYFWNDNQYVF